MSSFTAIDLFSGCGGLSLGLSNAGFRILAAVEIDSKAASTYRKNHPDTVLIENDIKCVSANELLKACGLNESSNLDLLAGCPPCQGFSRIKRKNKSDTNDLRNDLVFEYVRIVKALKPKTILLENVPGLMKDDRFTIVIDELKMLGYYSDWAILDAADFGVPQRRKRLIMIASRMSKIYLPKGQNSKKTVRDCISDLDSPSTTSDELHKMYLQNTPRIKALIAKVPQDGGSRTAWDNNDQLACHKNFRGFKDVYGRMKWDDVAPTLTGGCINPSKGRFLHPSQNRAITLREAALLQSFPLKYYFSTKMGLGTIARMIGDSVPPVFGAVHARHLIDHLKSVSN